MPLLVSKTADTAQLHKKLRILGIRWAKHDYRRDSIVLSATLREPVEGTRQDVVLVYFTYRGKEWDELLLLINRDDEALVDIANTKDVFFFDKSQRLRYHYQTGRLYNYFYPAYSRADEMLEATKTVVRLALQNDSIKLTQNLFPRDTSYKRFARLGEAWLQQQEEQAKVKMEKDIRKLIRENIGSPESLVTDGNFTPDTKKGTCMRIFRCTKTGKKMGFYFIKRDGHYLLYKVYPYQ